MYLKNNTGFNQQFKASGNSFTVKPGATVSMTMDEYHDHTTQFLLARGVLVRLEENEGLSNVVQQAEEQQAKIDERKLEVNIASEDTTKKVMVTQCAAAKKNGERCLNNVTVPMEEYDDDTPFFCSRHRNESPEDYEKADGSWRKKVVVEPEPEPEPEQEPVEVVEEKPVEEPAAEEQPVESEQEAAEPEPVEEPVEEPKAEAEELAAEAAADEKAAEAISDEEIAEALAEALADDEGQDGK